MIEQASYMRPVVILCLLLTGAQLPSADAQTLGQRRVNTWAARNSAGQTFGGTWTATEDQKTGTVSGSWALLDAEGRSVASGGWSAAKSPTGWTGNWRAVAVGRPGEHSGTWSAKPGLSGNARFSDLFAKAAESAVSGTWRAGAQTGSWTIQVFN